MKVKTPEDVLRIHEVCKDLMDRHGVHRHIQDVIADLGLIGYPLNKLDDIIGDRLGAVWYLKGIDKVESDRKFELNEDGFIVKVVDSKGIVRVKEYENLYLKSVSVLHDNGIEELMAMYDLHSNNYVKQMYLPKDGVITTCNYDSDFNIVSVTSEFVRYVSDEVFVPKKKTNHLKSV